MSTLPIHSTSIMGVEPQELDAETLQAMLDARVYELACSDRERETITEAYQQERTRREKAEAEANRLKIEKEDLQVQLTRAMEKVDTTRADRDKLQTWRNMVREVALLPHEQYGPYSKLAWITEDFQRDYPASVHGGSEDVKLRSMAKWNESIAGTDRNTNCVNRALEPLEAAGVIRREKVDLGNGRTHYKVIVNEDLYYHPRKAAPEEERKHNGGNKRCPQCGGYCKKKLTVRYECEKCGIDFDSDLNPIGHEPPALTIVETPTPEPEPQEQIIQPVLTLPVVRRPLNCHCGIRSYWYQDGLQSHCERCEPFHVRSAS